MLVEFVSANPTGPLHVGHGRQAAYGATLAQPARAPSATASTREYYINDAGRQMDILAVSVWVRYLEACGESLPFPENGYRGEYVRPMAQRLRVAVGASGCGGPRPRCSRACRRMRPAGDKEAYIDALIARCRELHRRRRLPRQCSTCRSRRCSRTSAPTWPSSASMFDRWTSERALADSGAIDHALAVLEAQGRPAAKDGALWFRATEFGDEKDRVVVRENGVKTYFASDIAYHLDKCERGFKRLIDVLGADHHGYVARVRAGLIAMGEPADCLEVTLIQFVSLFRGGEKIPMGKREAQFVTLRQLRAEVGNDACRFFYLMRSHDQPLDFDLELAKSRTNENPVYYIQYAHARVASVMRQLGARGLAFDRAQGLAAPARLDGRARAGRAQRADALSGGQSSRPRVNRAPHALVHYLRELANVFHTYYNARAVHRRGRRAAQRAPRARARRAAGAAQRARAARRLGAGEHVSTRPAPRMPAIACRS